MKQHGHLSSLPLVCHFLRFGSVLLLLLLLAAPTARAEKPQDSQTFMLTVENDAFGGTDRYYTNGLKAAYVSKDLAGDDGSLPGWVNVLTRLPMFDQRANSQHDLSIAMGQNIYTPDDKDASASPSGDHPYAGWLYASFGLNEKTSDRLDILELTLGVVGRAALAQESQDLFHAVNGNGKSEGWASQLHNELGLDLTWQRVWRLDGTLIGADYDFLPRVGLTAGNVLTAANAGAQFRIGHNLPIDFGTPLIAPGAGVGAPADPKDPRLADDDMPFGYHFLLGVDGRAVARDIFLDGNTWESSASVTKEPVVGDFYTGIGLSWGRFKATFTEMLRSPEFSTQKDWGQVIGSVTLAYTF